MKTIQIYWRFMTAAIVVLSLAVPSALLAGEDIHIHKNGKRKIIIAEPQINSEAELAEYVASSRVRLDTTTNTDILQAVITFNRALTYSEVSAIIPEDPSHHMSLLAVSAQGEETYIPYPLASEADQTKHDPATVDDSVAIYVACYGMMTPSQARGINASPNVLCADLGPINLLGEYPNAMIIVPTDLHDFMNSISVAGGMKLGNSDEMPIDFELSQNYPNPFNPSTTVSYSLPQAGYIRLTVSNILGQEVVVLVDQQMEAGRHIVVWDATNKQGDAVSSGIYFYKIETGSERSTKKMLLIR